MVLDIRARNSAGRWLNITTDSGWRTRCTAWRFPIPSKWGLDSARQEGELAGKIQILQELLGEESSSAASLRERTISELSTMLADLQQRLRSRES